MAADELLPVLLNARAGPRRQADREQLVRALDEHGISAAIEAVEPAGLRAALARFDGVPRIGVAGGDGTLRTAARALAGSATTLVPFPTGTLNHFARRLGIDTVEVAAAALRHAHVRTLPVGRANEQIFLNTAVLGAYPHLVELRTRIEPFLTKWPAAAVATAWTFARFPRVRLTVKTPGQELSGRTSLFWVGVGRGSFPAVHESPVPDLDQTLEAILLPDMGRWAAFRLSFAIVRHRFGSDQALSRSANVIRTPILQLGADRPVRIALDGEPYRLSPPIQIVLEPEALRVLVGPETLSSTSKA